MKYLDTLLGKKAARRIPFATPLSLADVEWRTAPANVLKYNGCTEVVP